jgi:predicted ABC-type ATPase
MPNLYIIAGCNGAGKTTASFTILPEILDCREFVNADIIAADISPLNPESVAFEAGRMTLRKIHCLLEERVDFAFETTLATRSYVSLIKNAKREGFTVTLLFFWLDSPDLARRRVLKRVQEGGHNIPPDVIERRYYSGIDNLMNLYTPVCDNWMIVNNINPIPQEIALGGEPALSEKVMHGLKIAMRKMVEAKAVSNADLVISDNNGNIKDVPAKDYLRTMK